MLPLLTLNFSNTINHHGCETASIRLSFSTIGRALVVKLCSVYDGCASYQAMQNAKRILNESEGRLLEYKNKNIVFRRSDIGR